MRDPCRYVLLMELKCAKRHVKSDGLYHTGDGAARFYRASKREGLHAAALAIRGVEYVSRENRRRSGFERHTRARGIAGPLEIQFAAFSSFSFFLSESRSTRTSSLFNAVVPRKNAVTDLLS